MKKRGIIVLMVPSRYPGLTGGDFTLVGEDEEIQIKIQHGLKMGGGDGYTTV